MIPIYNKTNFTSTQYLTKSQADSSYLSKNKDDSATGTLTLLSDLILGNDVSIANNLTILGNTTIGDSETDNVNMKAITTFDKIPTVISSNSETYGVGDGKKLATKDYVDSSMGSMPNLLSLNNTWTGTNAYNTTLPTSTLTPSANNQFVTKTYADTLITNVKTAANTWTGTNTYNTNLPTSTLTPSANNQLVTKTYADTLITNVKAAVNSWSGQNTFTGNTIYNNTQNSFNGNVSFSYVPKFATNLTSDINDDLHLVNKKYSDDKFVSIFTRDNLWTGNNEFAPTAQNITMRKLSLPNFLTYTETSAATATEITGNLTLNNTKFNVFPAVIDAIADNVPTRKQLITKGYIETITKYRYHFGSQCKQSIVSSKQTLFAPSISGTNNTSGVIVMASCFLNFPVSTEIIGPNCCTVRIQYYFTQCNSIKTTNGTYTPVDGSVITRADTTPQFNNNDFDLYSTLTNNTVKSPCFSMVGEYIIGTQINSVGVETIFVRPIQQSQTIVPSTAGNSNDSSITYGTISIGYDAVKYTFVPFRFIYESSKPKILFQVPQIKNSPNVNGFISNFGFTVDILGGGTNSTAQFGNSLVQLSE